MFGKNATWPGSGCSTEMPSKRYSLVRGRPPLMRGSDDPGGNATPGARPASVMKLRPLSGSSTTFRLSMTCPSPDGLAAKQRRVGGDGDGFGQSAHLQLKVEPDGLTGGDLNALVASSGRNPVSSTSHLIRARGEPRKRVGAVGAGDGDVATVFVSPTAVAVTVAPGTAAPAWSRHGRR